MEPISSVFGARRIQAIASPRQARRYQALQSGVENRQQRAAVSDLFSRIRSLSDRVSTVQGIAAKMDVGGIRRSQAVTRSTNDIGLTGPTATTLSSSEEVNATPTSFSLRGPVWVGPVSTTDVTIGGVYDGDQGDDTIELRAGRDATIGTNTKVRFDVYDGGGAFVEKVEWAPWDPAGTEKTLKNGLTVTLTDGMMKKNESVFVDVSVSQDAELDPTRAFNGLRNAHPELQEGYPITDGGFRINGTVITVNAADSLNDVVGRINLSGSGVTAAYDAITEQLTLTHNTLGAEDVLVDSDTSGFVASMKLDTAVQITGKQHDKDEIISTVAAFSGVLTGSFKINDVMISVDVTVDTLTDVLDRINASGSGAVASFSGDRLTIEAQTRGVELELSDDTSGLLAALNLEEGITPAAASGGRNTGAAISALRDAIVDLVEPINALFEEMENSKFVSADLGTLRSNVLSAISGSFADPSEDETGFGIRFDLSADEGDKAMLMTASESVQLRDAIRRDPGAVIDFFLGQPDDPGFMGQLQAALVRRTNSLIEQHGYRGVLAHTVA